MTRPADTTARVHLALSSADIVGLAVAKAVAEGAMVDDILVLLLDTRDPVARDLAAAILQRSSLSLDVEEARALRTNKIPTGIAVIPVTSAEVVFTDTHPGVAKGIRLPSPAGHVRVVAISEGGATLLHLPIATPMAIGSA